MENFTKQMIVLVGDESYITNKLCTEMVLLSIDFSMTRVIDRVAFYACILKMRGGSKHITYTNCDCDFIADNVIYAIQLSNLM